MLNSIWHELTSGVYTTTRFTWFTLAKVQLHGNDLGGFQIKRFSVLNEMEQRPDEASLMEMFLAQLRKSCIMTADLIYFDNLPLSHADKCYAWLVAVVQKHVLQHKEKQLVHEYTRQAGTPYLTFPSSGRHSNAAPAAPFTRGRSTTRRGVSPRRSISPGGRRRKFTPRGRNFRSHSKSAGGRRKSRPRHDRSHSRAYSVGGTYKFTPRGNKRKDAYRSDQVCYQFQNTGCCT